MAETWIINEKPSYSLGVKTFTINFVSNSTVFTGLNFPWSGGKPVSDSHLIRYYNSSGYTVAYRYGFSSLEWTDTSYRTVTFETSPTGDLLTWLQANAVKQSTQPKKIRFNNKILGKFNDKYISKFNNEDSMSGIIKGSASVVGTNLVFASGAAITNNTLSLTFGSVNNTTLTL